MLSISRDEKKVLIVGYDADTVALYHIDTKEVEYVDREQQGEIFANYGNQFISYMATGL